VACPFADSLGHVDHLVFFKKFKHVYFAEKIGEKMAIFTQNMYSYFRQKKTILGQVVNVQP
jgi:hypothetical protein